MLAAAVKICTQPTNSSKTPSVFLMLVDVTHLVITAMSGITARLLHKYRVLFSAANVYNAR